MRTAILLATLITALAVFPICIPSPYIIHIGILILIWSSVATAWAYMARFGLVSIGHGAFLGIGAYTTGLLFNFYHLSPWIGMLLGVLLALFYAIVIGYCCFRFGIIGDYFALVTLALGQSVTLAIIAFRDVTGGSLGFTLKPMGTSFLYFQFEQKIYFYYASLVFLILTVLVWKWIDHSEMQTALRAIGEDEIAAATLGIRIIRYKMLITMISAVMTAVGGVLYAQYITYLNPTSLSGVGISLEIAFKAILGGMFTPWGPTVGAALIVALEEYVRLSFGGTFVGISQIIYGLALLLLIIFLPNGICGTLQHVFIKARRL